MKYTPLAPLLALFASACGSTHDRVGTAPTSTPIASASVEVPVPSASARDAVAAPKKECPALPVEVPAPSDEFPVHPPMPPAIEFPEKMEHFYAALAKLARHKATDHVRIAVFGDSNLCMDFQTGYLRRMLQPKFGEGGHGFVSFSGPWSHYRHMDVQHKINVGWTAYANTTDPVGDPYYGIGGIVTETFGPLAKEFVATAGEKAPVGKAITRVDIAYLSRKDGGSFKVLVDGNEVGVVDTARAEGQGYGKARFEVPDGPHKVEVVSIKGRVRTLGAALERTEPGIVIDSFGVGSLNTLTQAKEDPGISTEMLRDRNYDLLVYMTGAGDIATMKDVPAALHKLIAMQREALPDVSILIVRPADRGKQHTEKDAAKVGEQRREIAVAEGTAFWSLFDAMGGQNSMSTFVQHKMSAFDDGIHFNDLGGHFVADRLQVSLLQGFSDYLTAHPEAGCE
ncbi:MAG: hypothetical protein U0414_12020 [Polyangiaceae bacterium]